MFRSLFLFLLLATSSCSALQSLGDLQETADNARVEVATLERAADLLGPVLGDRADAIRALPSASDENADGVVSGYEWLRMLVGLLQALAAESSP